LYDAVILGGGPGGYAAALYAHNFGLDVAVVEKDKVGGTCLHRGCIPAKSLLQAAEVYGKVRTAAEFGVVTTEPSFDWAQSLKRKDRIVDQLHKGLLGLLRKRKVDIIQGYGRLSGTRTVAVERPDGGVGELEGAAIILATGSVPRSITGFEVDGARIVTSDHALDWARCPERVAIIGAGAIGVEFASLLIDLGSEVHLFEVMSQILPGTDTDVARLLQRALARRGVSIHTDVAVGFPEAIPDGVRVPFGHDAVEVEAVLVAVGRDPVTADIGLGQTAVETDRGFVVTDPATMQTAEPGVYAVGDIVAATPALAHAGFAEAIAAVTHLATGEAAPVDHDAIPLVVYTNPEVATVGLGEAAARRAGYEIEVAEHGFGGVARAMIVGRTEGSVKVVREVDGPILGASIVGPLAGETIHELMYAAAWEALPEEAAAFIHAHPTIAEAVGETLLASGGRSLH